MGLFDELLTIGEGVTSTAKVRYNAFRNEQGAKAEQSALSSSYEALGQEIYDLISRAPDVAGVVSEFEQNLKSGRYDDLIEQIDFHQASLQSLSDRAQQMREEGTTLLKGAFRAEPDRGRFCNVCHAHIPMDAESCFNCGAAVSTEGGDLG